MGRLNTDRESLVPHVWLGGGGFNTEAAERNIIAWLERNDIAAVFTDYSVNTESAGEDIGDTLARTRDAGVDVWLGIGNIKDPDTTNQEAKSDPNQGVDQLLLNDEQKMEEFLAAQQKIAEIYQEFYPEGRLILWHEEPVVGDWTGITYTEKAESIVKYGPDIFARQKEAIKSVSSELNVGIFPHDIISAPPAESTVSIWEPLMEELRKRDAMPDFTYVDSYRSHHEWPTGCVASDDFINSMIRHIKKNTDGRPVTYLGATHTDNNNYTPSKQALLGNFQAAIDAGVDSYGWYIRGQYYQTSDRCFNPFIPNFGEVEEQYFNSFTGSRDRLIWATLLSLNETGTYDPTQKFDLWLCGSEYGYAEKSVSLQTTGGEWEFIGDVGGYVNGDNWYGNQEKSGVSVFHALDHERFVDDGELTLRIAHYRDGGSIDRIIAVPHIGPGLYQTERDVAGLVEQNEKLEKFSFADETLSDQIAPDNPVTKTLQITESTIDALDFLSVPQPDEFERLSALESNHSTRDYFDLCVYGQDIAEINLKVNGDDIDEYSNPQSSSAFSGDREAVAYRGLKQEEFFEEHPGGEYINIEVSGDSNATIYAIYGMPCFGARNFLSDTAIEAVITEDYSDGIGQIENFSLCHQTWPGGATVATDNPVEAWLVWSNRKPIAGRGTYYFDGHEPQSDRWP